MRRLLIAVLLTAAASEASAQQLVPGRDVIYRQDGTANAPTNTYDRDRNLGSYRIGADNEGFAANGGLVFDYNASRVKLASGKTLLFNVTDISETDIAKIDGITNGTAAASKALVLDANLDVSGVRNLSLTSAGVLAWSTDVNLQRLGADNLGLRRSTNTQYLDIGPSGDYLRLSKGTSEAQIFTDSATKNFEIGAKGTGQFRIVEAGTRVLWYIPVNTGHLLAAGAFNIGDGAGNSPVNVYAEGFFQAPYINLGANNWATAGAIRTKNGESWLSRNLGNTVNYHIAGLGNDADNELTFGDTGVPTRLKTSLATPSNLGNGQWWVECTGTSPTRICATKVQDAGSTRTIASVTY